MITAEDIQLLVGSGEGYNAEFKISVPSKVRELTEEVCAFANAAGGVILIGVDDQNTINGVTIDNSKHSAIQNSINDITPSLHCSIHKVTIEEKTIVVIEVLSGSNKPYVFSGAIYVRIGPNSQKLTSAEQMRDFFQQSDKLYFDEGLCEKFDPNTEINNELFRDFKIQAHIGENIDDHQIFSNLKFCSEKGHFKNGAVLFFGKKPETYFEKAVIRCVAFKVLDKRFIIDDKSFGGPLLEQYRKTIQWLTGKLDISYDIEGQGSNPRKEIWEIPETVLKEAILNSLSHRDYYDKGATTTVELFDDRIEIANPGGLVSAISPSEFGKRSHSRNPLIFGLFARMHMVEQIGSGIIRMNDLMKEANLPKPEYNTKGIFSIVLMRPHKTVEKTVEKIIMKLIFENPNVTTKELMATTQLTRSSIEYQLDKLKKNQILTRIGPNKGGYWLFNSTSNFARKIEVDSVEKTVEEIITNMIRTNPKVTINEMIKTTGLTRRGVEYNLNKLKENGIIERKGPDKGGCWQIIQKSLTRKY